MLLMAITTPGMAPVQSLRTVTISSSCVRLPPAAYGRDEAMIGGLACGATASIGNAFNFNAGTYQRLRKAFFAGDMKGAQAEQHKANTVVNVMNDARFGGNGLAIARVIYELKGAVKLGPPRMPIPAMTDAQKAALKTELDTIGYFSWCDDVVKQL